MHFRKRPAWRRDWLLFLVIIALTFLPLSPWLETMTTDDAAMVNADPAEATRLSLVLAIPCGLIAIVIMYRHFSWLFIIDATSIESRKGIIARKVHTMNIADLLNITVEQSIFDRILFIGDVEFSSAASSGVEVIFKGVSRPMKVKELMQREHNISSA